MTQARIRAEAFNLEQNWGSTTPGGGCRYALNLAHVCAEVMSHRTRPEEAHFNERRAYTLTWGKGFLADFRNRTGPDSHEAGCLEEFQQNLSGRILLALRSNHAELMFTRPWSQDGEPAIYCHFKFLTCLNDQYWRGFHTPHFTQVKRPA